MKTKLFILYNIVIFLSFSSVSGQTQLEKSIIISKENLKQILTDNNKKHTINIVFDGFEKLPFDSSNAATSVNIIKQINTEINTPKKKAIIEVTNNIKGFRSYLEKNEIKYVYADGLRIRSSNIMTQEEANKISSEIIDTPPVVFQKEYNDTTKIGCYKFRLYYYETKLYASMNNYSNSLLNGYIDNFQTKIEETRAILNKFN
jgi:hypothetical protein